MNNTKEKILLTSLRLFASFGYEAVSVSMIADELGIVKSALYKHYKNKRDIFDSIVLRMNELDFDRAKQFGVPEDELENSPQSYVSTSLQKLEEYSKAQFIYWTEDDFASLFRRMLTLEQYKSDEMSKLYHQYLASGPVKYVSDIFSCLLSPESGSKSPDMLALEFYAPIFMLYSIYDASDDKAYVTKLANEHISSYILGLTSR